MEEHEPVILKPLEVVVADGKIDKAMRKLKRKMATEGLLREMKKRRSYLKPSEKRRRKIADAARRKRKKLKKMRAD